jgi:tetratricopeptide (TPR) repeat protein
MRTIARPVFASLLLACSGAAAGIGPLSDDDAAAIETIMDSLYRMRFDRALEMCHQLAAKSPQDPMPDVFLARTIWQRELSGKQALALTRFAAHDFFREGDTRKHRVEPDPNVERQFKSITRRAVERTKASVRQNPGDLRAWFLMGLAYQNISAFSVAFRGGWREAFLSGESTRRAHKRVSAHYPDFADSLLSLAVYDYVVANVNWFYRVLGAVVGIRGSESRGVANMQKAAAEGVLFRADARTMLILIYTRKRMFHEAANLLDALRRQYPENCLIPMDQGTLALELRHYSEAVGHYTAVLKAAESKLYDATVCPEPAVVLQRIGIAHNASGDRTAAIRSFQKALAVRGAPHTKTLARLDLARTLDLAGRREEAIQQYLMIQNAEDAGGSRALATAYLKKPYTRSP